MFKGTTPLFAIALNLACAGCKPQNPLWPAEPVTARLAAVGLERGDIVLGVNGTAVKSVKELQRATHGAGRMAALLIRRGDAQIFVPIQIDDSSG